MPQSNNVVSGASLGYLVEFISLFLTVEQYTLYLRTYSLDLGLSTCGDYQSLVCNMESPEQLEFQEVPQEVQQMFFSEYLGRSVQVKARNELYSRFVSLPEFYLDHMGTVKDFEVRDDDIWIVTYPKCGTTFVSEMIWLLSSDLDYKQAEMQKLVCRITHIE